MTSSACATKPPSCGRASHSSPDRCSGLRQCALLCHMHTKHRKQSPPYCTFRGCSSRSTQQDAGWCWSGRHLLCPGASAGGLLQLMQALPAPATLQSCAPASQCTALPVPAETCCAVGAGGLVAGQTWTSSSCMPCQRPGFVFLLEYPKP